MRSAVSRRLTALVKTALTRAASPDKNVTCRVAGVDAVVEHLNHGCRLQHLAILPLNCGTSWTIGPWGDRSKNGLLDVLSRAFRSRNEAVVRNELQKYFHSMRKTSSESAAETLGYPCTGSASTQPFWVTPKPWDNHSLSWWINTYPHQVVENRKANNLVIPRTSSQEIMNYSRLHSSQSHINQYIHLAQSVASTGLSFDTNNLPDVEVMRQEDGWVWVNGWDGNHRTAVAAALGYDVGVFRITATVPDSVQEWTHVLDGLYSVEDAKALVERMVNGCMVTRSGIVGIH
jgi:hypothetical protein